MLEVYFGRNEDTQESLQVPLSSTAKGDQVVVKQLGGQGVGISYKGHAGLLEESQQIHLKAPVQPGDLPRA